MMTMALADFLYHDRVRGKRPLVYLYITLSLVFADLCGLAAYFLEYEVAYYPERLFYLISLTLLGYYAHVQHVQGVYHWESENIEEESFL